MLLHTSSIFVKKSEKVQATMPDQRKFYEISVENSALSSLTRVFTPGIW